MALLVERLAEVEEAQPKRAHLREMDGARELLMEDAKEVALAEADLAHEEAVAAFGHVLLEALELLLAADQEKVSRNLRHRGSRGRR